MRIAAQVVKAIADGLRGHGLQPQALNRFAQASLGTTGVLLNQTKDQLPFAARVTGVDQLRHIFAFGLLDHRIQPALGLVYRFQVKTGRDHRQIGEAPFATFDIKLFRRLDFNQVAHCTGDHELFVLKVVFMLFKFAVDGRECPHDVLCHRRFFRYHQGLCH